VDILLGPEMRSTGEVMGIDKSFGLAFMKGQLAAGQRLPEKGTVFISVNDRDKALITPVGQAFADLGFKIVATGGTADHLSSQGVTVERVLKVNEGRPNIVDLIKNHAIDLLINTPSGKRTVNDSKEIRQTALLYGVPYTTTVAGAKAMAQAILEERGQGLGVCCIQDYYGKQ
jgi:carbamoyl-phosphate synthase large subunit